MGTFLGHLLPGIFFGTFAIVWLVSTFRQYFRWRVHGHPIYSNRSPSSGRREAIFKLLASLVGIVCMVLAGYAPTWTNGFVHPANSQHIVMFIFFALNAVMELVVQPSSTTKQSTKPVLPPGLDFASLALAFFMEALLFAMHLHGRGALDVHVHLCLVYAIFACAMATVLEMFAPSRDVRPPLLRATATLVQATWFAQIGFFLHGSELGLNTELNPEDMSRSMLVASAVFGGHVAMALLIAGTIGFVVYQKTKKQKDSSQNSRETTSSFSSYSRLSQQLELSDVLEEESTDEEDMTTVKM